MRCSSETNGSADVLNRCRLLDDVEPAQAIDDIYQPTVIYRYVGNGPVATRLRVGVEMAGFSRPV